MPPPMVLMDELADEVLLRLPPVLMDELAEEVLLRLPPVLMDELIEEVLLRLPPDEPAWLVRASAVCKPWRCILAAPRFRRRYREFHGTPPILGFFKTPPILGMFKKKTSFVPTSALLELPAMPDLSRWIALDCRHGRALFATYATDKHIGVDAPSDFTVLDPLTGHQHHMPFPVDDELWFTAAVLCATQGCDHHVCEEGHFLVVFIYAEENYRTLSGRVYSSEIGTWSEYISVPEPNVMDDCLRHVNSVFVGDAVYFNGQDIVKYQLGTGCFSVFEKPINCFGTLMTAEDGGLGFAAVVDDTNVAMWSRETRPEGAVGWVKLRVIDLKRLLPADTILVPRLGFEYSNKSFSVEYEISRFRRKLLKSSVEGTQVIFVCTNVGCYMVDLKSVLARKVSDGCSEILFPYLRFYIPAMEAASTSQGQ